MKELIQKPLLRWKNLWEIISMKNIVILGAGGHAHVIADIVKAEGNRVVAFLDDDSSQKDCSGPISNYVKYLDCEFVIGIGNNDVREKISCLNLKWHTAKHPSAIISESAQIGEGSVVMPNAVINARARVGSHCIINTSSIIEHDCRIGDFTHVSVGANLGGTVLIGSKTWIGIGSTIKNNCSIISNIIVGAGAVVVNDLNERGTYTGVPAKKQ